MSYEQKRLVIRVYREGPPEKVVDWEAVAKTFELCLHNLNRQYDDYIEGVIRDNTTTRPSKIDTGVDVVLADDRTGYVWATFPDGTRFLDMEHGDAHLIAAFGFPTEPTKPVEERGEGVEQ